MKSWQRIILLVRLFLKTGNPLEQLMGARRRSKRKKDGPLRDVGQGLLMVFVFAYVAFIMVFMVGKNLIPPLIAIRQDQVFFELMLSAFSMMTIIYGFFSCFSALAYSQNQDRLAAMPFRRGELLTARLFMIYLDEVKIPFMLGLPLLCTYGYYKGSPWTYYLKVVLAVMIQVLVPLAILVVISLLIMHLTPLAKSKDRFVLVAQAVYILMTIVMVVLMNRITGNINPQQVTSQMMNLELFSVMSILIPNLTFLKDFLMLSGGEAVVSGLLALGIGLAFIFLCYVIANRFYRPGVGYTPKKKHQHGDVSKMLRARTPFRSLVAKELKLVFRTPTILMNNVMGSFTTLIILVVMFFVNRNNAEGAVNLPMIQRSVHDFLMDLDREELAMVITVASLGIVVLAHFILNSSPLNGSAVSREGQEIIWSKLIPVSLRVQYTAKSFVSYVIMVLPTLLMLCVAIILLQIPVYIFIAPLIYYLWASFNGNLLALLLDARRPVLDWEDQIYAIKQNKSILFSLVGNWIMAAIFGFMIFAIFRWELPPLLMLGLMTLVQLVVSIVLLKITGKTLRHTMHHLEDYL